MPACPSSFEVIATTAMNGEAFELASQPIAQKLPKSNRVAMPNVRGWFVT
jgi:hypothetical protein